MTFIAALRGHQIGAPLVFDGLIIGALFRARVEQRLAPTLRLGDVAILDNLGSHNGKAVRAVVRQAGAQLLFLSPYSPNLNPIDQVFAKLKPIMREAQERTREATWRRIGSLLEHFPPNECARLFRER